MIKKGKRNLVSVTIMALLIVTLSVTLFTGCKTAAATETTVAAETTKASEQAGSDLQY